MTLSWSLANDLPILSIMTSSVITALQDFLFSKAATRSVL